MKNRTLPALLPAVLLAVLLALLPACASVSSPAVIPAPETVPKPADNASLDGGVLWCRGGHTPTEEIGGAGDWSVTVEDRAQWAELRARYGLSVDEGAEPSFEKTVILVLFYGDRSGSVYELTELAMRDGMACIGIHEAVPGDDLQPELVGCLVELDEAPLEINSYRDEESVG